MVGGDFSQTSFPIMHIPQSWVMSIIATNHWHHLLWLWLDAIVRGRGAPTSWGALRGC